MTSDREARQGQAVVIDTKRGTRHLDTTRSAPASLREIEPSSTVLDWVIYAIGQNGISDITYVGGYHIQKVIERYPDLHYRFQSEWQRQGEVAGLLLARPAAPGPLVIVRSGTICLAEAFSRLLQSDGAISSACYSDGKGERFAGLVLVPHALSDPAFEIAQHIAARNETADLEDWLTAIEEAGLPARKVDVDSYASSIHDHVALARTIFAGKGRTLEQIAPLIRGAIVLDQVRFKALEWRQSEPVISSQIRAAFPDAQVVVRSSAFSEDGIAESAAGRFTSVLNVHVNGSPSLREAVEAVLASYTFGDRDLHERDEILVQPQVQSLSASGVLLTRDLETGAPYYVLNIDRKSGRSDVVTSGAEHSVDTYYIARNADTTRLETDVRACLELARELEDLTCLDTLDIEFGIDRAGTKYLFQVRPIALKARKFELADQDLTDELVQTFEYLSARMGPHPTLAGQSTVFGTMPDWNPAEMIGTTPRPLALSLYQRLIGNEAWAEARAQIGYADVRPEPLIVSLSGHPYVDVRGSLNSFLPADIDGAVAEKWVNHCLQTLRRDAHLHDKIEFELTVTCLSLDFDSDVPRLKEAGLSSDEIAHFRSCMLKLTDNVLTGRVGPLDYQLNQLETLSLRRSRWMSAPAKDLSSLACRMNSLLADCERYGTVPFSIMARYAFIALALLRSLERIGVFSQEEISAVLYGIPTVASNLSRDLSRYAIGEITTDKLLEAYGHLRPSSYDITSPNYASAWKSYLSTTTAGEVTKDSGASRPAAEILESRRTELGALLREGGFSASADDLISFIMRSIPGREWTKFEFMKSVNAILESIAEFGGLMGFSRDDMSFVPIDLITRGATESISSAFHSELQRAINYNQKRWNLTCALRLPHLVTSKEDVKAFRVDEWTPNFISARSIVAPSIKLDGREPDQDLSGRIVLIRAADPGYDWIFSHSIAGLITQFGGAASHMAIRAAEFGLPAAIGCGEVIFNRLATARLIELDCKSKRIRPIA